MNPVRDCRGEVLAVGDTVVLTNGYGPVKLSRISSEDNWIWWPAQEPLCPAMTERGTVSYNALLVCAADGRPLPVNSGYPTCLIDNLERYRAAVALAPLAHKQNAVQDAGELAAKAFDLADAFVAELRKRRGMPTAGALDPS
jgi:hypothetical protein